MWTEIASSGKWLRRTERWYGWHKTHLCMDSTAVYTCRWNLKTAAKYMETWQSYSPWMTQSQREIMKPGRTLSKDCLLTSLTSNRTREVLLWQEQPLTPSWGNLNHDDQRLHLPGTLWRQLIRGQARRPTTMWKGHTDLMAWGLESNIKGFGLSIDQQQNEKFIIAPGGISTFYSSGWRSRAQWVTFHFCRCPATENRENFTTLELRQRSRQWSISPTDPSIRLLLKQKAVMSQRIATENQAESWEDDKHILSNEKSARIFQLSIISWKEVLA